MKQFAKVLLLTLGFGVLAVVLGFVTSGQVGAQDPGPPGGLDVHVVNTPLPVTGTVGISGTPTVNLGAGNTVGINGTVKVGNSASSPVLVRDVDDAARSAFHASADVGIPDTRSEGLATITTVPAGKRLVIEYVSILAQAPTGQKLFAQITVFVDSVGQNHFITLTPQGAFSSTDVFTAAQPTRLYADAGTNVTASLFRNATTGVVGNTVAISGYLVKCGSAAGCPLP